MFNQCLKCGMQFTTGDGDSQRTGMCFDCQNETYTETRFNYKCPTCGGQFQEPTKRMVYGGTLVTHHCPFCDMDMKGF